MLIGVAMILSTGIRVQSAVPGETRLRIVCDLITDNVADRKEENTLHPRSIYYAVINKINQHVQNLLTIPPAEYVHITAENGVLSVSSSGTDVVLARFPERDNLAAFGLTPSAITTLALPHNLAQWPTTALNGCTTLERITAYGEEVGTPVVTVVHDHFANCSSLKHIQIPSSVAVGSGTSNSATGSVFPHSLERIIFPASACSLEPYTFYYCDQLTSVDLSRCTNLTTIKSYAFYNCTKIASFDFSKCIRLSFLDEYAIATWTDGYSQIGDLISVQFPSSLTSIGDYVFSGRYYGYSPDDRIQARAPEPGYGYIKKILPNLRTVVWNGCTGRPSNDFIVGDSDWWTHSFSDYVSAGAVTEIFVP